MQSRSYLQSREKGEIPETTEVSLPHSASVPKQTLSMKNIADRTPCVDRSRSICEKEKSKQIETTIHLLEMRILPTTNPRVITKKKNQNFDKEDTNGRKMSLYAL